MNQQQTPKQTKWGGHRKGAGRKSSPKFGKVHTVSITLYDWHLKQLKVLTDNLQNDNLSAAIRSLIESRH